MLKSRTTREKQRFGGSAGLESVTYSTGIKKTNTVSCSSAFAKRFLMWSVKLVKHVSLFRTQKSEL